MRTDQFLLILPSNSSMRYFPHNATTSFTTELPQPIHLHGEWEVALNEIQFPTTFLHINHVENVIRFVDIENGHETRKNGAPLTSTEGVIPNGIYKNIEELISAINSSCKDANSHINLKLEDASGGKILFNITCDENKCNLIHHMNVSDNLLRILGCGGAIPTPNNRLQTTHYTTLTATKPNSKDIFTAPFIKLGFKTEQGVRAGSFYTVEPHGLLRGIPDKLFVYCDICEPYITGDVQTPLLRIVPVELQHYGHYYAYGANQVKHFSVPHYIPLRQTYFRRIEIDIKDQFGKRIPFQSGTLTVTLHFRRFQ
ncbi:uncharacterized protein [Linepithema humile]|uniref:uncharacterized protein n=1 Tax=Linepithema humile TaxID=83485 RepID=UPI00351ECE25